jgi:hypothetical protein
MAETNIARKPATSAARSTPLPEGAELKIDSPPLDARTKAKYVPAIGSLLDLAAGTRPDISFAGCALASFIGSSTKWHLACVQHVLHYLARTTGKGIVYGQDNGLQAFVHASFAPEGRNSVSGWVVSINGGAISRDSCKQDLIAQSSCETEYIALYEITREALWLWKLCPLIGLPSCPVDVWCDDTAALASADHDACHRRSKHISLRFHSVRERVAREDVKLHCSK